MGCGDNYPTDHCIAPPGPPATRSDKHQIWYFSKVNLYSHQLYRQDPPSTLYGSHLIKYHNLLPLSLYIELTTIISR